MEPVTLTPIGRVVGGRAEPIDDAWGDVTATIELDGARFGADAVAGLDAFSHLEVVFLFHRVAEDAVQTGARHPRGNRDWPAVGIFAQRGKDRPNRLGVSVCELMAVDGLRVAVRGLDAIDGTPVLDVKPAMRQFQPTEPLRQPSWVDELMREYWRPRPPRLEVRVGDLLALPEEDEEDGSVAFRIAEVATVTDEVAALWFFAASAGEPPEAVDPAGLARIGLHERMGGPIEVARDELDTWDAVPVRRLTGG